jgi:hypothetical protein
VLRARLVVDAFECVVVFVRHQLTHVSRPASLGFYVTQFYREEACNSYSSRLLQVDDEFGVFCHRGCAMSRGAEWTRAPTELATSVRPTTRESLSW